MISHTLIETLKNKFALDWMGHHGLPHWARVRANGLRLAQITGARPEVVELFAFLHDSCRLSELIDPEHGLRGALYAQQLLGREIRLNDADFDLLHRAITHHSDGLSQSDITVMTCWDADRLDLGRVGIMPNPDRLCTDPAKDSDIITWAYNRSISGPDT